MMAGAEDHHRPLEMPVLPLSLLEREEISAGLIVDRGVSWAVLGRRVGRHPTTIAREVSAGGGRDGYRPAVAHGGWSGRELAR